MYLRQGSQCGAGAIILLLWTNQAFAQDAAHHDHHDLAPGIIEPLITHHAVIEDELKLNYFGSRLHGESLNAHAATLEVAYAATDWLGAEVVLPFGVTSGSGAVDGGFGDIHFQVPKFSLLREHAFVMTTFVGVRAPTGSESSGLSEPGWTLAPHLLADFGFDNFGLQINLASEFETQGAVALEGNVSLAHSFLSDNDAAKLSPLIEVNVEAPIHGEDAGGVVVAITPGLKVGVGEWHVGSGVQIPLSGDPESDFVGLLQVGYHASWGQLF